MCEYRCDQTYSKNAVMNAKNAVDCTKVSTSLALQSLMESVTSVMTCNMVSFDLCERG